MNEYIPSLSRTAKYGSGILDILQDTKAIELARDEAVQMGQILERVRKHRASRTEAAALKRFPGEQFDAVAPIHRAGIGTGRFDEDWVKKYCADRLSKCTDSVLRQVEEVHDFYGYT